MAIRSNSGSKKMYSAKQKRQPMLRQNARPLKRSNSGSKKMCSAKQKRQPMLRQNARLPKSASLLF
jgi:hypothetical protein